MDRKHAWYRLAQVAVLGTLFLAGCPSAGDFQDSTTVAGMVVEGASTKVAGPASPANRDALVARVVELTNQERAQRGLQPVTLNTTLCTMADDYACEMIDGNFFGHTNPVTNEGPGQRAIREGYIFLAIGENLAGGQTTAEQAMKEWMNSTEGHRENILATQWREIGVSVRLGGVYGVYWVQEFGNPP